MRTIPQHISNIIQEIQKATNYEMNDEIEKTVSNWYDKFIKNKFVCPVCNGNGYKIETITKQDPYSGWPYEAGTQKVTCKVCDGNGWTKKKLKPVTEIVDWVEDD